MSATSDVTKVLMIEDNPVYAQLLREELTDCGGAAFDVAHTSSLADGLACIEDGEFEGVVLDLSLPDSFGLDTFTRTHDHAPHLPIVVLTGTDDEELAVEAVRHGAQDYLVKAEADGKTLVRTLRYALERKRLEAKLRQSQKMEAVGQLTGGIAHDFNNLLMVILGKLQALEWPLRDNDELLRLVHDASGAVLRGAGLTRRLLAFARQQPGDAEIVDMNRHIEKMDAVIRQSMGKMGDVNYDLDATLAAVQVDPGMLETVIINLVNNARDAMPGGGSLTIRTFNHTRMESSGGGASATRNYAVLEVTDAGVGMPSTVRDRAFEPFFSIKPGLHDTGLGLSMVHGFASQAGGTATIASEVGKGTTVQVLLPASSEAADPTGIYQGVRQNLPTGDEKVLVVEGDRQVRNTVVSHFRTLGYQVLEAADGSSVLDAVARHPDIALLFMDVQLPGGIDGPRVAREVLSQRPHIKVLYTSAYESSGLNRIGISEDLIDVLEKPYRIGELATKARHLLDE